MSQQININNLRSYLSTVVATQVKTTVPAYTNKYALVNSVTTTASAMNINPKTGTITLTGPTGTIKIPQPVINPLAVNSTTAYISTNNNQVAVTSQGAEDTIITSKLINITNIEQSVLYSSQIPSNTVNNNLTNLYDNISNNFWNPQLVEQQLVNSQSFIKNKLKYTFTGTSISPYKFLIKNNYNGNYSFPGFKSIKMYDSNNINNYINITPFVDTNNFYTNETVILLLDDNGKLIFDNVRNITLEIDMTPFVKKDIDTEYQFGPNTGVLYKGIQNIGKIQLAVAYNSYVYVNSNYGKESSWIPNISLGINNWNCSSISRNNLCYIVGAYNSYLYKSTNSGNTFTVLSSAGINNWISVDVSNDGQYITAVASDNYIYVSDNNGVSFTQKNTMGSKQWKSVSISDDGKYQIAAAYNDYLYHSSDYGATWSSLISLGINNWNGVAISNNGLVHVAIVYNGYRYMSIDYAANWTEYKATYTRDVNGGIIYTNTPQLWTSVAINENGTTRYYTIENKQVYRSLGYGSDNAYSLFYSNKNWKSVSCSFDDTYITAVVNGGNIWISNDSGTTFTEISNTNNWNSVSISNGTQDNNYTCSLRAGDYISINTSSDFNINQWQTPKFVNNYSSPTGNNWYDNKYVSSANGLKQVVNNTTLKNGYYTVDGGVTWSQQIDVPAPYGTSDVVMSDDGYICLYVSANQKLPLYSLGNNRNRDLMNPGYDPTITDIYRTNMSANGQYLFFIGHNVGGPSSTFGLDYIIFNTFYNDITGWNNEQIVFSTPPVGTLSYVGSFVNVDGDITIAYNDDDKAIIVTGTSSTSYTSWTQVSLSDGQKVYSIAKNKNSDNTLDGKYYTLIGFDSSYTTPSYTNGMPFIYSNSNGTITTQYLNLDYDTPSPIDINNTSIVISPDGLYQIAVYCLVRPNNPYYVYPQCITIYSHDSGITWLPQDLAFYPYTMFINTLTFPQSFLYTPDFSIVMLCGGYNKGPNESNDVVHPTSYISYDQGVTWTRNSSLLPTTQLELTSYYTALSQTNKTYFQIKDTNQNQVLGVSDNGFKMSKDLRVSNSNAYVLGGTMTIGPDEASSLLNDYTLNVDGTVSAKSLVILSDKRYKNVLETVNDKDSYDKFKNLEIVKYSYKTDASKEYVGLIAQDVKNVYDDVVEISTSRFTNTDEDVIEVDNTYSINYNSLIARLISVVKHSQNKIEDLEAEVSSLKQSSKY